MAKPTTPPAAAPDGSGSDIDKAKAAAAKAAASTKDLQEVIEGQEGIIAKLQAELKSASKVAKAGGPVGRIDKKKYEVHFGMIIKGVGKKTAQEIADSEELLSLCVDMKSENVTEL
jgi:hypothetical protein